MRQLDNSLFQSYSMDMKIVRIAGSSPKSFIKSKIWRRKRAGLLYSLFYNGYNIYNGNGDQNVHLENIQKKIIESDSFVFTPTPTLDDYFQLSSIIVGKQTNDKYLLNKPLVLIGDEWQDFINLIASLNNKGSIKQKPLEIFHHTKDGNEAVSIIKKYTKAKLIHSDGVDVSENIVDEKASQPAKSICVFCSASLSSDEYYNLGYGVGKRLADNQMGCISGAGKSGIMGSVVKGSIENGGYAAGSNIPHIIELEGLPDGLSEFWARNDIYTRMIVMIERSTGFIILPGGMGSIQEILALLLLKTRGSRIMEGKKIVIVNYGGFWNELILMLNKMGLSQHFTIVDNGEKAVDFFV
jgi:uncharacterized protein (TIGR00730 family)